MLYKASSSNIDQRLQNQKKEGLIGCLWAFFPTAWGIPYSPEGVPVECQCSSTNSTPTICIPELHAAISIALPAPHGVTFLLFVVVGQQFCNTKMLEKLEKLEMAIWGMATWGICP